MDEFKKEIIEYAEKFTSDESSILRELREHCYAHYEDKAMLSGFVQGRVLSMFSRMIRPSVVLEIGTYLGYSALCFAEGLVDGGKVITLDVNEETNKVARSFVEKSAYKDQIEFHLGEALNIIPYMPETFDLVFIDADKPNYANYYNLVFEKLRPGAFIIADNVLWSGKVHRHVHRHGRRRRLRRFRRRQGHLPQPERNDRRRRRHDEPLPGHL